MSTCALCFADIVKHNDKILVNGKGAFIIKEELSTLGFVVHLNSSYVSKRCVQKLKKRRGVINNLRQTEADLYECYHSKATNAGQIVMADRLELLGDDRPQRPPNNQWLKASGEANRKTNLPHSTLWDTSCGLSS